MRQDERLGRWVSEFFRSHLLNQRGVSRHTLLSYRDAVKLLLRFAADRAKKDAVDLCIHDLDVPTVLAFLDHLELSRANGISTRNQRLAALRSFFRYLGASCPEHLDQCQRICLIRSKRASTTSIGYLEQNELDAIFSAIDGSTRLGLRDLALFTLLYNTGARVQEALDLRPVALQLEPPPWVRIVGKGRKTRTCPLWPETVKRLRALVASRGLGPDSDEFLFANRVGGKLTRFGVRYLLAKYVRAASQCVPSLKKKPVHPHTVRHTTAAHMLQAGVELNMIRSWLGHVHLDTTNRYAEIDLAMKRRILEACPAMATRVAGGQERRGRWHQDRSLMQWLEQL